MSKVSDCSEASEFEDEPEVYQSSGDEWDSSMEGESNKSRRSSKRLSKKPRMTHTLDTSDSSLSEGEAKKRPKNGMNKKQKLSNNGTAGSDTKTARATIPKKFSGPKMIFSDDFATGSFVILKKDAQVGDPNKHPCIWRIDGKALLQKYEAFDDEGNVRHRNTSIYTGWSPLDKDLYAPVTVNVAKQTSQNFIVELHWDKLKDINMDSD